MTYTFKAGDLVIPIDAEQEAECRRQSSNHYGPRMPGFPWRVSKAEVGYLIFKDNSTEYFSMDSFRFRPYINLDKPLEDYL